MILIVDDEPRRLHSCVDALEDRGFTVILAMSVEDFREKLARSPVSLVILDVMLPPGPLPESDGGLRTGLVLLGEIRRAHTQLPVVLFSNANLDLNDLRHDPNTHVVRKEDVLPFELANLVDEILKRRQPTS
jgi:DNA-binding response OmpR family regulator